VNLTAYHASFLVAAGIALLAAVAASGIDDRQAAHTMVRRGRAAAGTGAARAAGPPAAEPAPA
jgi:hypothetical protein